jgi:hypothetical protein
LQFYGTQFVWMFAYWRYMKARQSSIITACRLVERSTFRHS